MDDWLTQTQQEALRRLLRQAWTEGRAVGANERVNFEDTQTGSDYLERFYNLCDDLDSAEAQAEQHDWRLEGVTVSISGEQAFLRFEVEEEGNYASRTYSVDRLTRSGGPVLPRLVMWSDEDGEERSSIEDIG